MERRLVSLEMEKQFEWRKWIVEIPYINFPAHWEVRIIPPFTGAVVRFHARLKGSDPEVDNSISVYLDCYDELGFFGEPYWEAYSIAEDTARFPMADVKGLIEEIDEELKKRENK